jgi:hypothetical protein
MVTTANSISGGYDDWRLPNYDELELMYITIGNGAPQGNIGDFEPSYYLSSSEYDNYSSRCVYFGNGADNIVSYDNYTISIRAIRSTAPEIGDIYQGGIVFQINENGSGLVAATEDLTEWADYYEWGSAIALANYYNSEGYWGWHVPSVQDAQLMYNTIGYGGDNSGSFEYTWYWTSSEANSELAFYVDFNGGGHGSTSKFSTRRVRVIRSVTFDNGIGQEDVDAAYAEGAASVTPEDGIDQEDVDAAFAEGSASVDITSDNQDSFDEGAASVTPEDGIGQDDVDAAYADGVTSVATQNIPLDLPEGWSMFGYTCTDSVDAMVGFSEISDKIEIVKDEWGLAYLPSWDFNAMGGLHFSEGYQIKMIEGVDGFQFCSTITPEDGITQADLDALAESYEGWCESDLDNDGICDADEVWGCMDPDACNFVLEAEFDVGTCTYPTMAGYDCEGNLVEYVVGMQAKGGIVFYVDDTGLHGLVADMQNLEPLTWGCSGTSLDGAGGQAMGTGYQNTLDIVAGCSEIPIAASEALDYETVEGHDDWYLPSRDELSEIYNTIGPGGPEGDIAGFGNSGEGTLNWYWSSSEFGGNDAWSVYFGNGSTGIWNKSVTCRVRVVRAF